MVFCRFSKLHCLVNESGSRKVRRGKDRPASSAAANCAASKGSAVLRMSPLRGGWGNRGAAHLCLLPRALVTHTAVQEDYTTPIITLYLLPSLYIAISYLKGVVYIPKGKGLITCKALMSLTHLLELGSLPLSISN